MRLEIHVKYVSQPPTYDVETSQNIPNVIWGEEDSGSEDQVTYQGNESAYVYYRQDTTLIHTLLLSPSTEIRRDISSQKTYVWIT